MKANWPAASELIFEHEGGYVDHPSDPGGATNLGITRATLERWRERDVTKQQVRDLGRDEAAAIYRAEYWNAVQGDALPGGVDVMVFDMAVNAGPGRSAKILQEVVGSAVDGHVGPNTLAAVRRAEPKKVVVAFHEERMAFYQGLSHWKTFGRGWTRRSEATRELAWRLATQPAAPEDDDEADTLADSLARLWRALVRALRPA